MFVADLHNDLVQRVIEGEDVTKFTPHGLSLIHISEPTRPR